jgi:hypothetical protein
VKKIVLSVVFVITVAAASYAVTRGLWSAPNEDHPSWLRREFKLNESQLAAIEKLQIDYAPICTEHCHQVMRTRRQLSAAPQDVTLQAEIRRLEEICRAATTEHLRRVAAEMSPAQARRFLALMEPKVAHHDHAAPLGLQ